MRSATFRRLVPILGVFVAVGAARGDEPIGPQQGPGRGTPYVLDRGVFAQELQTAKDSTARLGVLAKRWELVKLAVAHCSIATEPVSFHSSFQYWQSGFIGKAEKTVCEQDLTRPIVAETKAAVLVQGDCLADITVKGDALIHVYGDLGAKIVTTGQHCEIVIGGDIQSKGGIEGAGIFKIFVGGNSDGYVRNSRSTSIWINGNLNGEIGTGVPSTEVHVMGDFNGTMKPLDKGALAYVDVRGFMSAAKIRTIADFGYTQFQATVGVSDQPPGLYPKRRGPPERLWVIHTQRQASPSTPSEDGVPHAGSGGPGR
jgi:hypothetical protein